MTPQRRLQFNLQSLAAEWRVFGMMLVVFARQILQIAPRDPRAAALKAEQLEMGCYAFAGALSQQIAFAEEAGPAMSDSEDGAISHLRAIAVALLTLAVFIRRLMQRFAPARGVNAPIASDMNEPRTSTFGSTFEYYDTS